MLRWILGTAVVTLIAAIVITWQAQRCEATREDCQAATSTNRLPNPMLAVPASPNSDGNKKQAQNQTSGACPDANAYFCRVLTPTNLPTIYLVLIGIGGVAVAIATLKILEKQTEAALLNAQAVIKSERPWIAVHVERVPPENLASRMFRIVAINKGKTPAEIVEGHSKVALHPVLGNFIPPDDLMAPFVAPIQSWIVPEDSFEAQVFNTNSFPIDDTTYPPQAIFAYGKISYWDVFVDRTKEGAKPHESRWCLTYLKSENRWHRTANGYSKND